MVSGRVPVRFLYGSPFRIRTRSVFQRVRDQHLIAGGLSTDLLGGDELLFEQGPLGHYDRGPAQAGDFRDGPDRDFHRRFASPPEAVDDRKELLLGAMEMKVLPHELVDGRERHHRYEGLRILSRSERR